MSDRSDLTQRVAEAIRDVRFADFDSQRLARVVLGAIVNAPDWHIISSAAVGRIDEPPCPDEAVVEVSRYNTSGGRGPIRITTVAVELDGEIVYARGTLNRELVARSADDGYIAHADAQLGLDFLQILGHRLGVPGCEDVPERLAKTGHP